MKSAAPGELLCQDTFYVGHLKGVREVYMQAVVDTYGSYAFGYLHTGKLPEHAALLLHNDVLPQYQEWGLRVIAVLTDNGRKFCSTGAHPYELLLALNDIEHRKTKVRSLRGMAAGRCLPSAATAECLAFEGLPAPSSPHHLITYSPSVLSVVSVEEIEGSGLVFCIVNPPEIEKSWPGL